MSESRTLICDICKSETARGALWSISIEQRHQPFKRKFVPGVTKRVRRRRPWPACYELDVCKACSKTPLTIATLLASAVDSDDA